MRAGLVEIIGLFLVVAGCGTLVAAAALVSTALAVAVAGAFIVLAGVIAVYVAFKLDEAAKHAAAAASQTAPRP